LPTQFFASGIDNSLCFVDSLKHTKNKFEYQNPKQYQMTEIQITKTTGFEYLNIFTPKG